MAVDYSQSEQDRELLIRQRQRNTAKAFEEMRKKIDEQIATMNMSTVSEKVKRQQLEEIREQLQKSLGAYYSDLESGLKSDMISIGESVLSDSAAFYNSLNMPLSIGITSFPVEIMENVINGSVYGEKWFLSGALWGDYQSKLDDINKIITEGIGMNLPLLDIAKQLEQFVDPAAMKPSAAIVTPCLQDPNTGKFYSMDYVRRHPEKDWSGFKETKSRFYYGKVDYNAQRLARTLISHAYQQNVVRQAQANPFATGVKWEASGGERMCEICEERDGKIFPVDDVPLDHPNGMCTFTVETPSMMEMSNTLADWVNGEPTDWDDQLNAYYAGVPIEHKSAANIVDYANNLKFGIGYNSSKVFDQLGGNDVYEMFGDEYWSRAEEKKRFDYIKQETGFSDEMVKGVLEAFCGNANEYIKSEGEKEPECWFYRADTKIRNLDGKKWENAAKKIDEYIVASRKYGGEIYRGMALDNSIVSKLKAGGLFIEQGSISSWSSDKDIARDMAEFRVEEGGGEIAVVIRTVDHPFSAPVSYLSMFGGESEVVVSNLHGNEYYISSIEEKDGILFVDVLFGG